MSSCDQISIKELASVVEISQTQNMLVEIESKILSVEVENCPNQAIEIQSVGAFAELHFLQSSIIEIEKPSVVIEFPEVVIINNPETPPSGDTSSVTCSFEAGEAINVNRVVSIAPDGRIVHADKDDADSPCDVVGVSKQSGAIGQFVDVVKFGRLTGASFGSPSQNFFLGNNGQIQTSVSASGTWLIIGTQLSATEFFVNIGEPIRRN